MRKIPLLLIILCFALTSFSYALEVGTHQAINEYIVKQTINGFSLDLYLKTRCGIEGGVFEYFDSGRLLTDSRRAWEWVRDGGKYEDKPPWTLPYTRSLNHFHDPLEPLGIAGFKGLSLSSVIWSQMPEATQSPGGHYSWLDTRGYFYDAMTSTSASHRSRYFAETFRGIGQLMHLVEDASVPAHTRDDAHIFGYHYELAVDKFRNSQNREEKMIFDDALASPLTFDPSILAYPPNPSAAVPIAKIIDTDKYTSSSPNNTVTLSNTIGLSEYSNANFFSEDTIFRDYPEPSHKNTNYESFSLLPISTVTTGYVIPHNTFYVEGYGKKHLAGLKYFAQEIEGLGMRYDLEFTLDDRCYEDYAKDLLPRAVGYAAGLLKFFFRGNIEISLPAGGVYASTDDANTGFTRITLLAQNKTANRELMDSGTIELVVRYRLAASDPFKTGPVQAGDYNYKVVLVSNNLNSIPIDAAKEFSFDMSADPLPVNAVDVSLLVVYHGILGMEDGAVAVGFKDISDPTPIDIYNNMNKICINEAWDDAGSQSAIQQVDVNGDGVAYGTNEWDVYPHNLRNIYIKFYSDQTAPDYASPTYYDYEVDDIPDRGFRRALYVLGDDNFNYSFYAVREGTDQNDYWTHEDPASVYNGYTIRNQVEDPPVFFDFRGYSMWAGSGFIYVNPAYPEGSQCDLSLLQ